MKAQNQILHWGAMVLILFITNVAFAHFDPTIGRFLNRDPAGYSDGPNEYQYVKCTPISSTDPYGLDTFKANWEPFSIINSDVPVEVQAAFTELFEEATNQENHMHSFWKDIHFQYIHGNKGEFIENPDKTTTYKGECVYLAESLLREMNLEIGRYIKKSGAERLTDPRLIYKYFQDGRTYRDHWSVITVRPKTVSIDADCVHGHWQVKRNQKTYVPIAKVEFNSNGYAKMKAREFNWLVSDPTGHYHGVDVNDWLDKIYPGWGSPDKLNFNWIISGESFNVLE